MCMIELHFTHHTQKTTIKVFLFSLKLDVVYTSIVSIVRFILAAYAAMSSFFLANIFISYTTGYLSLFY